jgi:hypothetical protein
MRYAKISDASWSGGDSPVGGSAFTAMSASFRRDRFLEEGE